MRGALIVLVKRLVGALQRGQAANARTDDRGGAVALLITQRHLHARLLNRLLGGRSGELRIAVRVMKLTALQPLPRLEVAHLAGDRDVELIGGKALDFADAALSLLQDSQKLGTVVPTGVTTP